MYTSFVINIFVKKLNCSFQVAKDKRLLHMNELEELRNKAYDNVRIYKDKTKIWKDKKIMRKDFRVGELVLLYNSRIRLFPRKLKSRWSGPYTGSCSYLFWSSNIYNQFWRWV